MVNSRKNQNLLWADKEFISWLKQLKAKKMLDGIEINNLGELTKEMLGTQAIKDIEREIMQKQNYNNLKLKLDSKRLLR